MPLMSCRLSATGIKGDRRHRLRHTRAGNPPTVVRHSGLTIVQCLACRRTPIGQRFGSGALRSISLWALGNVDPAVTIAIPALASFAGMTNYGTG